ncbi:DUF7263 family protein [Halostella salina]|uniref:DUF7263 family protein n=1 Tax=Halostella salina TaxID=1547897 RepID=UPI000EF78ABF|nr:hypothetical protein [Halostella salina]
MSRAQANMPALLVALIALSTVAGVGLFVADDAVGSATRDAGERRVAVGLSDRLVSADGPLAVRANVLDARAVASLTPAAFESQYPVARDHAVRVTLDGEPLVSTGDADGGTTIRRVVLVERRERVTRTPALGANREQSVTLPRRTPNATVELSPPNGTTVTTVRANGRVVLHDDAGVEGTATVDLSRFETATLTFASSDRLPDGSVTVTYYPSRTRKALLGVTVDG